MFKLDNKEASLNTFLEGVKLAKKIEIYNEKISKFEAPAATYLRVENNAALTAFEAPAKRGAK